jgi:hypothetical protein
MKNSANKTCQEAAAFQKGDHLWLNLKNIKILQLLKILFWFNVKYEIIKIISFYVIKLNVLGHIYSRFYMSLLKRVKDNSLLLQIRDNIQPLPLFVNSEP